MGERPTSDLVLAEPAGLRLDEWVLEHVMGFSVRPADPWVEGRWNLDRRVERWASPDGLTAFATRNSRSQGGVQPPLVPSFSRSIEAAWTALDAACVNLRGMASVERLAADVWAVRVSGIPAAGGAWRAAEGRGDTAPLAICRAVLLAVPTLEGSP